MISNVEGWHCLAVIRLSPILKRLISTLNDDFYCLNCFHSFTTKNKLESHKEVCKNKNFSCIELPYEENLLLKCTQYYKSIKAPALIYSNIECLTKKVDVCKNNPEKSSTTSG